jgi:predicted solute-binding protein
MKKLGITASLFAVPIFHKLKERTDVFELSTNSSLENAKLLREDKLDAAFLSPIDYARHSDIFSLIPGVAVSSEGFSRTISLFFKEGIKEINSISTDITSVSEMVLAKIVMLEKYSTSPKFIVKEGALTKIPEKADAALVTGDANLSVFKDLQNKLDLVDEWLDITELPYVHGFWVNREDRLTSTELSIIKDAASYGATHLIEIASLYPNYSKDDLIEYLSAFMYDVNQKIESGLSEFLRMAYYHHIITDLPDVKFLKQDNQTFSVN